MTIDNMEVVAVHDGLCMESANGLISKSQFVQEFRLILFTCMFGEAAFHDS